MSASNPFQPGDWAQHRYRDLDAREVVKVEGDSIYIRIGTLDAGPMPASNYDRIPREGA